MNINNVSFGKIFKVNAPYVLASEIALIANGHGAFASASLKNQVKEIFPDKNDEVYAYADVDRKTYLFSGKEGEKFRQIRKKALDEIHDARRYFKNTDYGDYYSDKACMERDKAVAEMINGAKNIQEINVNTETGSNAIKSINLIA